MSIWPAKIKEEFLALLPPTIFFYITLVSKRIFFSCLQGLFNFAATGKPENLPLVTMPAQ